MKTPICLLALAWTIIVLALTALQSLAQSIYEPYTFTTLAGNAGYGSADGTGSDAQFWGPSGVAVDSNGNVYVADTANQTIRKITPAGAVRTLAGQAGEIGSTDGMGSAAQFAAPSGVGVDSAGNVYVADPGDNTIRKVTPAGAVTTLAGLAGSPGSADGTGSAARFNFPYGVAVDSAGNVYVADSDNHTIRRVTPTRVVTTLAGLAGRPGSTDGTGRAARFGGPSGVAVDSMNNVYVVENGYHTIRKVTPAGAVSTLAGLAGSSGSADGTGNAARFTFPKSVAVDSAGNVYVADSGNHTIRKVTSTGVVTTLAGVAGESGSTDGTGSAARFAGTDSVAVDSAGNVYVADSSNNTIRKITPSGVVTTLAGPARSFDGSDGTGSAARFAYPVGIAVDSTGNAFVAESTSSPIRKVTPTGVVTTLPGLSGCAVAVDTAGSLYLAVGSSIQTATLVGTNWVVTTLAGLAGSSGSVDGTGSAARFQAPQGLSVDSTGNVYVADSGNNTIRKVTPEGIVRTLAGLAGTSGFTDGTGSVARFFGPQAVAVDSAGNVYVADTWNHTIRKVTPTGVVTTLAGSAEPDGYGSTDGTGSAARFRNPRGVSVDNVGNVYVADSFNYSIRKVTPARVVTSLAGGKPGSADGTGSDVRFGNPSLIPFDFAAAVDSAGNVYVADSGNHTIRKGYPAPRILNTGAGFGFNGGHFGFNLSGPSGHSVVVEASNDLLNWLPFWTNTFTFPATLNFSDLESGILSTRFYRARLP